MKLFIAADAKGFMIVRPSLRLLQSDWKNPNNPFGRIAGFLATLYDGMYGEDQFPFWSIPADVC